jgi:hypothetical protein
MANPVETIGRVVVARIVVSAVLAPLAFLFAHHARSVAVKVDVADYERLYRTTRGMHPEVRSAFRKRLRRAAKIGADAARIKIRTMPATGGKYTATGAGRHYRKSRAGVGVGLRSTLALNIRVTVSAREVAVRQFTKGLRGQNARDLPKDIDRGGWKHPTYNHKPVVFQRGYPYFDSTMKEKRPEMEREVGQVLDDIKGKVIAGKLHLG